MSLSNTTNRSDRTLNGVATVFSFDFKVFAETDLVVIRVDGTTEVETTLTLGVDYTVSGVNADAGSITLVNGPGTSGDRLIIKRVMSIVQPTRLRNQGDFFPATHERAFDRSIMIDQQQQEEIDRSFKLSKGASGGVTATPVPGFALGWDAGGNLVNVPNTGADQTAAWTAADALIRSDLAAPTGAGLVGHVDATLGATTVENVLGMGGPNLNPYVTNIAGGPTLAASSGAGALTGTYAYVVTFITATGETESGGESGSITVTAKNIELSAIPVSSDPAVIGRKIYRSFAGNKDPVIKKLVTTINDNTTTTYTDSTPDGSLGAFCPRLNTTGANGYLSGVRGFYYGPGTCASFGHDTMNNSTGYANSAFGPQSMQFNTTGFRNCAFGIYSLNKNTTGARNSAFGVHALNNNITADDNTAFGYGAAINTDNFSNCAFGAYSLQTNVTGVENCAFGMLTLQANTGSGNTAFGHSAGYTNVGGAYNAYFGFKSGYSGSGANFNTAVGHSALYYNVSGAGNTAVGNYALEDVTGSENTAVGRFAGRNLTGSNNTIIGSTAMQTAVGASGNVCIGFQAGYYETGSDKLFIDTNAHASEADARLKSLIYGIFNQYDTNAQFLYLNSRVAIKENVGFYGTAPAVKQTVTGSRGGNAALASLLTALANYGLITNSSTA